MELGHATSHDSCVECLSKQSAIIESIAARPLDTWVLGSQDRCLLDGLCPVPFCGPGVAAPEWSSPRPTMLLQSMMPEAVNSAASSWSRPKSVGVLKARLDSSAVEDLLTSKGAARLALSASLLQALRSLFRADEVAVAAALDLARVALGTQCTTACSWASCSSPEFSQQCSGCAVNACELAQTILAGLAGKGWEHAGKTMQVLVEAFDACAQSLRCAVRGADGAPLFSAVDRGLPMIWEVLSGPLVVLAPIVLWSCGMVPKKAKEGQDGLMAVRHGLRTLISTLQATLNEVLAELARDELLFAKLPSSSAPFSIEKLEIPGFSECRQSLLEGIIEGQRKQLLAMRQFVGDRLALVKTKSSFKA